MGNGHIVFACHPKPNTALLPLEAHSALDNVPDTSCRSAQADSAGAALQYDTARAHGPLGPLVAHPCPQIS